MYKNLFTIYVLILISSAIHSQTFISDHRVAKQEFLRKIPSKYIYKARTNLHVAYQHTSHGTHVSNGLFGLPDFKQGDDTLFSITNNDPIVGKLDFRDNVIEVFGEEGRNASDLSHDETAFIEATRNFLDDEKNSIINVVMWSWCNISGHDVARNYIAGVDSLINEYGAGGTKVGKEKGKRENPVTFIFMTGHANTNNNVGEGKPKNQADLINNHCRTYGYFCLDYYNIDTHDMDDNYWEDAGDNGNSETYGGNYYEDWQSSHTVGIDYYYNRREPGGTISLGSHTTQHITSNRKAFAMWWLLARIAGWDGDTTSTNPAVESLGIDIPNNGTNYLNVGDSLNLVVNVTPISASRNTLKWKSSDASVATVNSNGTIYALKQGTVKMIVSAENNISDTIIIHILNEQVTVDSIDIISPVGTDQQYYSGQNYDLEVWFFPDSATDTQIKWSIQAGQDISSIDDNGLLHLSAEGSVLVQAALFSNPEITDSLELNVYQVTNIHNIDNFEYLIFPNPTQSYITVSPDVENIIKINVMSVHGKPVISVNPAVVEKIDISRLIPGTYVLKLFHNTGKLYYRKFIKN